ncbi:MAG: extracellular solute-binding protein [Anaerolineae bacterium]
MERKPCTRRQFLHWSVMVASTAALAACAPAAPPAPQPTQAPAEATKATEPTKAEAPTAAQPVAQTAEVRFNMWDWYAMAPGVVWADWNTDEAFPVFQEQHPNIRITFEPQDNDFTKILTQMAAGSAADILTCWEPWMTIWAQKGQILDLQPFVDRDIPNADDIYIPLAWVQMWDPLLNMRMGMLADLDVTSVYYNKTAFQEAGVPLPTIDWTYMDYTAAAEKLTVKDANGQVTRWGGDYRNDFWTGYCHWIDAFGGKVRDEETRMKCLLGEDDALAGLEWIRENEWDKNIFIQGNQLGATGIPNTWTGILPAKVACFAERSADQFFALADGITEFEWDIAHVPSGPKGRACMGLPDQWVIYKGVAARGTQEQVWEVMKWLAGEWYQEKIASVAGRIPGLLSVDDKWASILRQIDPRLEKVRLETVMEQIVQGHGKGTPMFRFQQVADELIAPAIQQIFLEGTAPVSIMKEVAEKVNQAQLEAEARGSG